MNFTDGILSEDALMLKANRLQAEYNKKRQRFFNKARAFYNSTMRSKVVTEELLVELIFELADIKQEYENVCEELKKRGRCTTFGGAGGVREGNELDFRRLDLLHVS